jgi:hypothetical protein
VIEDDRVAGEIEIGGEDHPPRVGRRDGRALGAGEVGAPVRRRGSLLKTLRTPNPDTTAPSIGTTNGPRQFWRRRHRAEDASKLRTLARDARLGALWRRDEARVHPQRCALENSFASTFSVSTRAISLPAAVRAVMADRHCPAAGRRDRSPRALATAVVTAERLCTHVQRPDRDRAQRLARAHVETHDLARLARPARAS